MSSVYWGLAGARLTAVQAREKRNTV